MIQPPTIATLYRHAGNGTSTAIRVPKGHNRYSLTIGKVGVVTAWDVSLHFRHEDPEAPDTKIAGQRGTTIAYNAAGTDQAGECSPCAPWAFVTVTNHAGAGQVAILLSTWAEGLNLNP
jgi:hypothetical protein